MSKLPIKILFAFVFLSFFISKTEATSRSANAECYSPNNYGTNSEETIKLLQPIPALVENCVYQLPEFTSIQTNMCAEGTRCEYTGLTSKAVVRPSYEKTYFFISQNDRLKSFGGAQKKDSSGKWVDYYGVNPLTKTAYTTLAECQAANPNRITGVAINDRSWGVLDIVSPVYLILHSIYNSAQGDISIKAFSSVSQCEAALPKSTTPFSDCASKGKERENYMYVIGGGINKSFDPAESRTKSSNISKCIVNGGSQSSCTDREYGANGLTNNNFYKCTCEQSLTCGLPVVGDCEWKCKLNQIGGYNFANTEAIKPQSPLLLIKVISNFMFYAAIFIFIVNFVYSGYMFIRSSGEPDKLKEANSRLTNNIAGLVFVLLIGGLLNYIIGIIDSSLTTTR